MTENEAINYLRQIDPKHIECVELFDMKEVWNNIPQSISIVEKALSEIRQYRAIGTVEECREARERQRAKKPICNDKMALWDYTCPVCGEPLIQQGYTYNYCDMCGNRIDWSDTD